MTVKLDHHHRITVQKIFGHPINHNIKWRDVLSLLGRFGEVHETHRGNWALEHVGGTLSLGSTREKDLSEDSVIRVRHFLAAQGLSAADAA